MVHIDDMIKDRQVLQVLRDVDSQIRLLPPNGQQNHRRDALRQNIFNAMGDYAKEIEGQDETFALLAQNNPTNYEELRDYLLVAIVDFGIKI